MRPRGCCSTAIKCLRGSPLSSPCTAARSHKKQLPCTLCLAADILLLHGLGVKLVIVCGAATLVSTCTKRSVHVVPNEMAVPCTGALCVHLP